MGRPGLGPLGEDIAAAALVSAGLVILDRNWRHAGEARGELDIVAREGRTLVFCEVKSRRGVPVDTALEAVTPAKQARLRKLARAYLAAHAIRAREIRFDVVAVCWRVPGADPEVAHLRGVA